MPRSIVTITRHILLASSLMLCHLTNAQSNTVTVSDPRPVVEAIRTLEETFGVPITYEDPIAVNESQLEDITERVRNESNPSYDGDSSHRVIVQKERTISFTYRLPSSLQSQGGDPGQSKAETEAAVADALSSVLAGYASLGGPETFAIRKEDGVFHVVPINFLDKEGKLRLAMPILDTKITILPKQRSRQDLLEEILQSVSRASGIEVSEGMIPYNFHTMEKLTGISGSNVTACSLLSRLLVDLAGPVSEEEAFQGPNGEKMSRHRILQESTGPLSWELLYGPGFGYALNVHSASIGDK